MFDLRAFQLRGSYGVWEFASLDSLQAGIASRYRVTRDTGSVTAACTAMDNAVYIGDEWDASRRLSLTLGLRADIPLLWARPPYVSAVDSTLPPPDGSRSFATESNGRPALGSITI